MTDWLEGSPSLLPLPTEKEKQHTLPYVRAHCGTMEEAAAPVWPQGKFSFSLLDFEFQDFLMTWHE